MVEYHIIVVEARISGAVGFFSKSKVEFVKFLTLYHEIHKMLFSY